MTSGTEGFGVNGNAAAAEAARLRDEAAAMLRQAATCGDPRRRDALTRAALASIDRARRLVDAAADPSPPLPGTSLH
jgi:hypothetical protein